MTYDFVVPPLRGAPTGGTVFNRELIAALRRCGKTVRTHATFDPGGSLMWLDSLFLGDVPKWAARGGVGLLTHYLPSLVGERADEEAALRSASAFVVPSPFLADELVARGVERARIGIVEPGVSTLARPMQRPSREELSAVLVANLTPAKGVLELLEALPADGFRLRIVGSLTVDPGYARKCQRTAGPCVKFDGALEHEQCIAALRAADLLVSASRMESYGMALAEARASGVPVLAREGGNVANLVDDAAGGQLVPDAAALARVLRKLASDPAELASRIAKARASARTRSWDSAAQDFISVAESTTRTSVQTTR